MVESFGRWFRFGPTFGLRYIGTIGDDRRVYTNRKVASQTPSRIDFVGGGYVATNGTVIGGGQRGKIVVIGKDYFSSVSIS